MEDLSSLRDRGNPWEKPPSSSSQSPMGLSVAKVVTVFPCDYSPRMFLPFGSSSPQLGLSFRCPWPGFASCGVLSKPPPAPIAPSVEIEIEIYPLQKGVLKDIISPVGGNNLVPPSVRETRYRLDAAIGKRQAAPPCMATLSWLHAWTLA